MAVFDTAVLAFLVKPDTKAPLDPATGQPVTHCQARLNYLLEVLQRDQTVAVVPTPVLAEILIVAGPGGPAFMEEFTRPSARYRIAPFDDRAAVELAEMTRTYQSTGDKTGGQEGSWAKVKFDRQIIAIARVERAKTIYSDDKRLRSFAERCGFEVIGMADLPLPPEAAQMSFADIGDD